jgi:adenylate cyclase
LFTEQVKKTLILGTACSLFIILTSYLGVTNDFKNATFDLFSRYLNPDSPSDANTSSNIVIVEIDQRSLDDINREGISWPWPRQIYAPIIEYMSEARVVFVDILFTEPSSYGLEDDQIFAETIRKNSNVYLPIFLTKSYYNLTEQDYKLLKRISLKQRVTATREFRSAINPIDLVKDAIVSSGNVTIAPDSDGVYRRIPFFFKIEKYLIPHFLLNFLLNDQVVSIQNGKLYKDGKEIPMEQGKVLLNYYSKQNAFRSYSASQILKSYLDSKSSGTPIISKDSFKDKIVLIGLTAPGLFDLRPTAVSSVSSGIVIHATTLDNFYNDRFITKVPNIFLYLIIILVSFFINYFVLKSPSFLRNLSIFVLIFSVIIIFDILFFKFAIYLNFIDPVFSLILSFIVAVAYSYATEGKKRELTEKTLLQYMDKQVAEYLLNNPSLIKPGGMKKHVTIFFADISGFTTIAENTTPEQISKILIEVLNLFTDEIIENKGVIDKYIGDCVMAFWGAPIDTENDEINACQAAVASIKLLAEKNKEFEKNGLPRISFRVGIHSGEAIVGNLGSDRVFDYTVVGDSVNLASRMESLNKHFGTDILISEDTLKKTGEMFIIREIGPIEVKGKTVSTRVYELIDKKENASEKTKELVELYNKGLRYYLDKNFQGALETFTKLIKEFPGDGPSEFYIQRSRDLISTNNLTNDWKVIKFDSK